MKLIYHALLVLVSLLFVLGSGVQDLKDAVVLIKDHCVDSDTAGFIHSLIMRAHYVTTNSPPDSSLVSSKDAARFILKVLHGKHPFTGEMLPADQEASTTPKALALKERLEYCLEQEVDGQGNRQLLFIERLKQCLKPFIIVKSFKDYFLDAVGLSLVKHEGPLKLKTQLYKKFLEKLRSMPSDSEKSVVSFLRSVYQMLSDIIATSDSNAFADNFIVKIKGCLNKLAGNTDKVQLPIEFFAEFSPCMKEGASEINLDIYDDEIQALMLEEITARIPGEVNLQTPDGTNVVINDGRIETPEIAQKAALIRKKIKKAAGRALWLKHIKKSSEIAKDGTNDLVCTICQAGFEGDLCCRIDCNHDFHYDCLAEWVAQSGLGKAPKCPVCRNEISLLP